MKCDELKAYKGDVYIPVYGSIADADVYIKKDADTAISELKADINNVLIQNRELCQALQAMYSAEEYTNLQDENTQLKQKLENVQASMYCDVVDANMENRRLKRALWMARAERAKWQSLYYWYAISDKYKSRKFDEVERKCRAKAEEYR